ncbi:hypothetical protein OAL29_01425 [Candidatus Binatia bacterium]|nr:hypothetical protein [Candidatus Binatia bacterium]
MHAAGTRETNAWYVSLKRAGASFLYFRFYMEIVNFIVERQEFFRNGEPATCADRNRDRAATSQSPGMGR